MATTEAYVIAAKENRQSQLEALDIGDSVAIARRIEMQHGFAEGAISEHNRQVRGIMDQQVHRARRRRTECRYTVENGSFLTRDGSLIVVAVATRIE